VGQPDVDTWLREHTVSPQTRKVAAAAFNALFGGEGREISLLYALWYIACAGDENNPGTFERLIDVQGGAQERRFVEGAQSLSLRMAAALGDRVQLSTAGAEAVPVGGRRAGGQRPTDRASGEGDPGCAAEPGRPDRLRPAAARGARPLHAAQPTGRLIKVEALYSAAVLARRGLSGAVVSDTGPGKICYDVTPADNSLGGLLAFVGGDEAAEVGRRPRGAEGRGRQAVRSLLRSAGGDPTDVVVQDWSDEVWSRGAPVHLLAPGALTQDREAIWAPVGRIHWAGTETATFWHGYMTARSPRAGARPPRCSACPGDRPAGGRSHDRAATRARAQISRMERTRKG
jgi:monoamine oxidase